MEIRINKINTGIVSPNTAKNKIPSFGLAVNPSDDEYDSNENFLNKCVERLNKVYIKFRYENNIEKYIDYVSNKKLKSALNQYSNKKIEDLNYIIAPKNADFLNTLLKESDIKNVMSLVTFIRVFRQNSATIKAFKKQNIEAIKIYGYLKSKSDLNSYPNLLLYLYNQEENEDNPNYNKLNDYTNILKISGIKNETEFDEKLAYLKPEFNNFETTNDKINAIEYLQETYNDKINLLNDILKSNSNPKTAKENGETLYTKLSDVVNYLYLINEGKSLGKLSEYLDVLLSLQNIKYSTLNKLNTIFGDINNPKSKISLVNLLEECNVSVEEINLYTKKNIISDIDLFNIVINKTDIINQIHTPNPQESFKTFHAPLTAVYTKGGYSDDIEAVETLLSVIDTNKLNNQDELLKFYNDVNNTNLKKLTTQELYEFIDLYKYTDNKGITDLTELRQNKSNYSKALPLIERFLKNDASDIFIGKSPLELYKEYNYYTDFSSYEKIKALNDFAVFNQIGNEQTEKIKEEFNNFRQYFDSKQNTLDFLTKNNINFDDSEESVQYKNQCLEILGILSTEPEKAEERINKISKTGFLPESKNHLNTFITYHKQSGNLNRLIKIIADKEVPSLKELNSFFKKYANSSDKYDNLIEHLSKIPENVDFKSYIQILEKLNEIIKKKEITRRIDNDNILNIDISKYIKKLPKDLNEIQELICSILNIEGNKSFINGLKSTYTDTPKTYSAYKIAREIAYHWGKTDESYLNLVRELDLYKQDSEPSECSDDYEYIYSIKAKLPKEFVDFVNSYDWQDINNDKNKIPNMSLHSKLRLLDRTLLTEPGSIKTLNEETTKEKLKETIKSIYTQMPTMIKGNEDLHRIIIQTPYGDKKLESIFSNNGELITVIPVNNSIL